MDQAGRRFGDRDVFPGGSVLSSKAPDFDLELPSDARVVDMTFRAFKSRFAEFVAKPTRLSPPAAGGDDR